MDRLKGIIITDDREYEEIVSDCIRKENYILSLNTSQSICDLGKPKKVRNIEKRKFENYDVLILDENWLNNAMAEERNKKECIKKLKSMWNLRRNQGVIILCNDVFYERMHYVYKYNTLRVMMNKIITSYEQQTGIKIEKRAENNTKTKIISVVSESGGTGSSAIAMGLCQELSLQDKRKCLYLSLGRIHQEMLFAKSGRRHNIRELLYNMFYGNAQLCNPLENSLILMDNGVMAFKVTTFKNKISELSGKQFIEFMEYLVRSNLFDVMVLDIGNNIDEICKIAIKSSDKIIMVSREIGSSIRKNFMEYMGIEQADENQQIKRESKASENESDKYKKFIGVLNNIYTGGPKFREFFADEFEEEKYDEIDILIEEDKNSFQWEEGVIKIYLNGAFGEGISKITKVILEN